MHAEAPVNIESKFNNGPESEDHLPGGNVVEEVYPKEGLIIPEFISGRGRTRTLNQGAAVGVLLTLLVISPFIVEAVDRLLGRQP